MVDFSQLLSQKIDDAKKPPPLPAGTYETMITKYEFTESKEKKTPMLTIDLKFLAAREDVVDTDALAQVDLSKISRKYNFVLSDNARWRLAEFIKTCGIPTVGRGFMETIPELSNQTVLAKVSNTLNPRNPKEQIWDIDEIVGAHGASE